jgi:rubrerythrin
MTIEEAIKTAIEYEVKVKNVYAEAVKVAGNDVGQRVFNVLSREEQGHVDYLNFKLEELRKTGTVNSDDLETAIPSPAKIKEAVGKLENKMAADDRGAELEMLRKALEVEIETSNYYQKMVDTLEPAGQKFFKRFLEIEEGHQAIIRAEIDSLNGSGFWFDIPEFDLEH